MMKSTKLIALLLARCMTLGLCACAPANAPASAPESSPSASEPEATEPEATEPEATEPEVTEPEVTEPEVTEPEVTEPEVTEPEVTEPEAAKPEAAKPVATKPEATKPEAAKPSKKEDTASKEEEETATSDSAADGPHTHKYVAKVFKPSCEMSGWTQYTCACGDIYVDGYKPDTGGHDFSKTNVVAPTPTEPGYTEHICIKCGEVIYKDNYVLHESQTDWTEGRVTINEKGDEVIELGNVTIDVSSNDAYGFDMGKVLTEAEIMEYVNSAAPSDFEGKKAEIHRVDAEDPANMRFSSSDNKLVFTLNVQPEGTLMSHSLLKKTSSGQEAVDYFIDTMIQIDWMLKRDSGPYSVYDSLRSNGDDCGEYFYKNSYYELDFSGWGNNWVGGGNHVTRSVYLNALAYFGGEKMGVAVWSMLEEHLRHRDNTYLISDELAAKYGLKILHKGTTNLGLGTGTLQAGYVKDMKITDGTQTWLIDYPMSGDNASVNVYIPS